MKRQILVALIASFALAAFGAACDTAVTTNTNSNVVVANANRNTNANTSANANTNANRRTVNANISRAEYDKDKTTFTEDAKRLGRTIGSGANDGWLWTKTRADLATADDLRDSTINVDVENGVVTLSGSVATPAQKAKAGEVSKSVQGVTNVKNNLTVAPSS